MSTLCFSSFWFLFLVFYFRFLFYLPYLIASGQRFIEFKPMLTAEFLKYYNPICVIYDRKVFIRFATDRFLFM